MFVLGFFTVWLLVSFATYSPCLASSFPRGLARSRLALLVTLASQAYVARPRLFSPCPAPRSVARFGVTCRPHNHVHSAVHPNARVPDCPTARPPDSRLVSARPLSRPSVRPVCARRRSRLITAGVRARPRGRLDCSTRLTNCPTARLAASVPRRLQ